LLIALVILALGASITSAMLWDRGLAVYRSTLISAQRQAWQYDLGAEAWVEQILRRSADKNDTLSSPWAQHLPPLPVLGGAIRGGVEDLQGRFNLNNLVATNGKADAAAVAALKRLLALLQIDPNIASAIVDWEDPDDDVTDPGGAESGYYASLDPAYAPTNGPFVSITSLRLVKGITPAIYTRLAPYVSALPVATALNINTAPATVLAAVVPDFSLDKARALVAQRGDNGFSSVADFQSRTQRKIAFPLTLQSSYFLLTVTTTIGTTQLSLYSVLYRNTQDQVQTIARSLTSY
ncbi:MAG: type II secretion system minor pseudopilin GspK, partial [Terriglobales bacterium]